MNKQIAVVLSTLIAVGFALAQAPAAAAPINKEALKNIAAKQKAAAAAKPAAKPAPGFSAAQKAALMNRKAK